VESLDAMNKNNKLLIVGGTGFIGSHIVATALRNGYKTTVLSLHKTPEDKKEKGVEYIVGNIRFFDDINIVLKNIKIDYVINIAGYINHSTFFQGGQETLETHFLGVQNIIKCLDWGRLKRFVQIGSSDEYGDQPAPQDEEMSDKPISSYSMGKSAAGRLLQMLYKTEKFPAVILRLFLVYGPGQNEQRFLPQIISGCLKEKSFPVSSGEQKRDFCYIDDIVDGIFKAMRSEEALGEVINLASGRPILIKEILSKVCDLTGSGSPQFGKIPYRKGESMELYANISKAKRLIGWEPKVTLTEGLKKTIYFYNK